MLRRYGLAASGLVAAVIAAYGCGGDDKGATGPDPKESAKPTVTSTTPANGATGVALDAAISATFSQPVSGAWLTIDPTPAQAQLTFSGTAVTMTPVGPLEINRTYRVTPSITDDDGNSIELSAWTFTTRAGIPVNLAAVSTGSQHWCGMAAPAEVLCWGSNEYAQLGRDGSWSSIPLPVLGSAGLTSIVAGHRETCALTATGAAYCWGLNAWGELGDGTTSGRGRPTAVAGGLRFTLLALGDTHTCGVTPDNKTYCWGWNVFGALGDGTTTDRHRPNPVAGDLAFTTVTGGNWYTCGLTVAGAAYCWGINAFGGLGDGTVGTRWAPVRVAGGHTFVSINAGSYHTCALTADGDAYCWGQNVYGQLGDGTTNNRLVPVRVLSPWGFSSIDVGDAFTCALRKHDGAAFCWGGNQDGRLGIGAATGPQACGSPFLEQAPCSKVPVAVTGGLTFASLSVRASQACALASDGAAYCWGYLVHSPKRVVR